MTDQFDAETGDPVYDASSPDDPSDDVVEEAEVDVVDDDDFDPNVPDLSALSKSRAEAEKSIQERTQRRATGDYEGKRSKRQPQEEQPEEQPEEEEKPRAGKGEPHARARVAERVAREKENENRVLRARMEQLIELVQENVERQELAQRQAAPQPEQQEEEEIEIPPYEVDPQAHNAAKMDLILKKFEQAERAQAEEKKRMAVINAFRAADTQVREFMNLPEVGEDNYNAATEHLAKVRIETAMIRNPDLSKRKAIEQVSEEILRDKLTWLQKGINPGRQFYSEAIRAGYKPYSVREEEEEEATQPVRRVAKPNPDVQKIRKDNQRESTARTVSSLNGSPAKKKLDINTLTAMDDDQWETAMEDMAATMGKKRRDLKISDFVKTFKGGGA